MYQISDYASDICWYIANHIDGGTVPSALAAAGMPRIEGDSCGVISRSVRIGRALDAVTKEQAKLTGQKVEQNILVERWGAYLAEKLAKPELQRAKSDCETFEAMHGAAFDGKFLQIDDGYESFINKWKAHEELLIEWQELYDFARKKNNRIRRSTLYDELLEFYIRQFN